MSEDGAIPFKCVVTPDWFKDEAFAAQALYEINIFCAKHDLIAAKYDVSDDAKFTFEDGKLWLHTMLIPKKDDKPDAEDPPVTKLKAV